MQTSDTRSEIRLQLPDSMKAELAAYATQQAASVEAVIEKLITDFLLAKAQPKEEDPAIGAFLNFLEKDVTEHPERLQSFSPEWVRSALELVEGVEIGDINAPLLDDDN